MLYEVITRREQPGVDRLAFRFRDGLEPLHQAGAGIRELGVGRIGGDGGGEGLDPAPVVVAVDSPRPVPP